MICFTFLKCIHIKCLSLLVQIGFILFLLSCEDSIVNDVIIDTKQFEIKPLYVMGDWRYMQGGAVYHDILVCLTATDQNSKPYGYIYDLQTGKRQQELLFGSTIGTKRYYTPHANQVSFSNNFYDENSDFPLLYVSQVNGGNGENDIRGERGVLVYNLRKGGNGVFNPELVQAIIPDMSDTLLMSKIGNYTPNYIVDTDKNQIIIIGYPYNSWYKLDGQQPVAIMRLPLIEEGNEIVFTNDDILDSFCLESSVAPQQSFYYNGKIYTSCGVYKQAALRVIDLEKKKVEWHRDLTDITFGEPQFLGLWNHKLLYYENGPSGQMFEIYIPEYMF